jgi:hypothetical protein
MDWLHAEIGQLAVEPDTPAVDAVDCAASDGSEAMERKRPPPYSGDGVEFLRILVAETRSPRYRQSLQTKI